MITPHYQPRLVFQSFAECLAAEAALGMSSKLCLEVVNPNTGAVVLRRAVVDGAWTTIGRVDFAAVTATPAGVASSVAGAVVTLAAGHSLATLARVLRWQIVQDGAFADVSAGAWSIAGNDLTVPAATAAAIAAALGASKTVRLWAEGVSELCIGGAGCAVQPAAGSWRAFVVGGLDGEGGRAIHAWGGAYRKARIRAYLASYAALNTREDRITVGWVAASACAYAGIARNDTNARAYFGGSAVTTSETLIGSGGGGSGVAGTQAHVGLSPLALRDDGAVAYAADVAMLQSTYSNIGTSVSAAAVSGAKLYENHNLRAVISGMECA